MNAVTTDNLNLAMRLLNERFPLLVEAGQETVRERVAFARTGGEDQNRSLEIVTYRGRRLHFDGIAGVTVEVAARDAQGVPIEYALILDGPGGSRRLRFVA